MENTVDMMLEQQVQDDAVQTAAQNTQTLAEVIGEDTNAASTQSQGPAAEEEPKGAGWIRTRIEKGVAKGVAEAEARIRAEYEAKYAPLHNAYLEQEADRLVASGKITDRELALDYLKRGGTTGQQSATTQPAPQPRDEQGRFVKAVAQPEVHQRGVELFQQAQTIKAVTGVDVMAMYNSNPDVKQKVLNGDWDFHDVYEASKNTAPAPVRGANRGSLGATDFTKMSDAQFAKLEEALSRGAKITI